MEGRWVAMAGGWWDAGRIVVWWREEDCLKVDRSRLLSSLYRTAVDTSSYPFAQLQQPQRSWLQLRQQTGRWLVYTRRGAWCGWSLHRRRPRPPAAATRKRRIYQFAPAARRASAEYYCIKYYHCRRKQGTCFAGVQHDGRGRSEPEDSIVSLKAALDSQLLDIVGGCNDSMFILEEGLDITNTSYNH